MNHASGLRILSDFSTSRSVHRSPVFTVGEKHHTPFGRIPYPWHLRLSFPVYPNDASLHGQAQSALLFLDWQVALGCKPPL